jgi:hypothetical protein
MLTYGYGLDGMVRAVITTYTLVREGHNDLMHSFALFQQLRHKVLTKPRL